MTTRITLWRELFAEHPRILLKNSDFMVTAFRYASGVEGLKIENSRGHLVILPWMGQMIWDAQFDGHDLTMRNMFSQPKPAAEVVATYGCFAFHSGLLANGCPSPEGRKGRVPVCGRGPSLPGAPAPQVCAVRAHLSSGLPLHGRGARPPDGRARLHAAVRGQRFVRFVPQLRCK